MLHKAYSSFVKYANKNPQTAFFLDSHWGIVPFTPFLYLFVWGATLRIILEDLKPPRFINFGPLVYHMWATINLTGPPLLIIIWFLIYKGGRRRVLGLWMRMGVDTMMFTAMATYHVADGLYARHSEITETHLFSRYLTGAVLFFILFLILRDWSAIAVNLYKARRISRVSR